MRGSHEFDAAVIGSGPNGLAAAITLAEAGLRVVVLEAAGQAGGSARTAELTLSGFRHDVGSAVLPLAALSPFLASRELPRFGLEWAHPPVQMAHPLEDGRAGLLYTSLPDTSRTLDGDGAAYARLLTPFLDRFDELKHDLLGDMRSASHPLLALRFGLTALNSASSVCESSFKGPVAAAFFAGLAAHSILPLNRRGTAAFGLVLGLCGHTAGWPIPVGGAGSLSAAMEGQLIALGGKVVTGLRVRSQKDLPDAGLFFFDTSPRDLLAVFGAQFPAGYSKALQDFRYGPGIFKLDWALSGPIPWAAEPCRRAGTVHVGGTLPEIAETELLAWQGKTTARPFVILAQPSLFDPSRAPAGKHVAWAYCHVPNGCTYDMTAAIEIQIERFAPGFRDLILARHVSDPAVLQADNANLVGGDIAGGAQTVRQVICRPSCRLNPYTTPLKNVYLCSASTPPGAGVHGMCGFHAARVYLKMVRR